MNISIRPAEYQDLDAISEIYNDSVLNSIATFDIELRTKAIQDAWFKSHKKRHPIFVADLDRKVIGWASLTPWSNRCAYADTAEISAYIHASFHGKGVGAKLIEALLENATKSGLHCIISQVAGDNKASNALNKKFGFSHVGTLREVGKKFDKLHDVHLYQLLINASLRKS